jgi:hypothetical protein
MFSTYDGLRSIATQAGCCRLLAVTCNQPHYFPPLTSQQLQDELSPIVISLKPKQGTSTNTDTKDMPFIAIASTNDWNTIKNGSTTISGSYIVEETDDDDDDRALLRRLIFLQNQNFIQTEIRIIRKKPATTSNNKKNKKKNNKSSSNSNSSSNDNSNEYEYDYDYSDDIYISTLLSFLLSPRIIVNGIKNSNSNSGVKQDLDRVVSSAKNDIVFNFKGTTTTTTSSSSSTASSSSSY